MGRLASRLADVLAVRLVAAVMAVRVRECGKAVERWPGTAADGIIDDVVSRTVQATGSC
jgi:hypothetical protein